MPEVELFHWNPKRPRFATGPLRRLPFQKRVNNFGDLLGPIIVGKVLREKLGPNPRPLRAARLLSIGSVMHMATDGDVIWGTGINGKVSIEWSKHLRLDIRAVRGPRTRDRLLTLGFDVPKIFGDPGLLTGRYFGELRTGGTPRYDYTVVPNFNEWAAYKNVPNVLDPRSPLSQCLSRIANSRLVVGTSLHALIVAESFGVAARSVVSTVEPSFKYEDYYLGSNRQGFRSATSVAEALAMGGEPLPVHWNPEPLLDAFPVDLWAPDPVTHRRMKV